MLYEGCTNSGPGRLEVPEVTRTDGPGFSLYAILLELSDPVFQSDKVRTAEEEQKSRVFQTRERWRKLSEQRGQDLVGNLVDT